MAKPKKFPKRILVYQDPNSIDYLVVAENSAEIEDGQPVGIYDLVDTKKKKVAHELV